jgi:signal transduction histidine kinase
VRDDGRGTSDGAASAFGIIDMQERAWRLDGLLTIRSDPGAGTEVALFVPRVAKGAKESR